MLPEHSQTGNSILSTQYTLRACNRDYLRLLHTDTQSVPELDCNRMPGKVAPLLTFDNEYGHWVNGSTRVFPPTHKDSISSLTSYIGDTISKCINDKTLWDLNYTQLLSYKMVQSSKSLYPEEFIRVMESQALLPYNSICAHSAQAYVESQTKRGSNKGVFNMPSQSTVVTGILGGLHNNTSLEMGFYEKEGTKDSSKRAYDPRWIGYICAGHTSHSSDAGKSRRITSYTRVRVISSQILDEIGELKISNNGDWLVYCMGITCNTDEDGIWEIVHSLNLQSRSYYHDQFDVQGKRELLCPATYMVYEKHRILYISISSGTILRSLPSGSMIDSHMMRHQSMNSFVSHCRIPEYGATSIQYKYSPFFMLAPFTEHDRPPRSLFASGQTTQGIFFPWSPATARVSPLHASKPIVTTEFMRAIEEDQTSNLESIWDVFPGEDLTVCYMNSILNYEDSMMISSGFADRGGFATMSLCTYRISESENIPEVGERLCGKKYKWWKVDCTSTCSCKNTKSHRLISTSARIPSGKVHQIIRTEDGQISIKILSFSQLLTGDKISTMHGQKGVVRIVPQHELPVIVMQNGTQMIADLYIAVGSIVSRQTNGQIYESAYGLRGALDGIRPIVGEAYNTDSEECKYLIKSTSGSIIHRQLPSGIVEPVRATVGITRVISQTQMTRERHHFTHRSEGKYSTGTHSGRADGGGVSASEMDFHAMYSSGLLSCAQEIFNRGNACLIPVCKICHAIQPLHDCGIEGAMAMTVMSFDCAIFDQISACVNGSCNRYIIDHI